MGPGSGPHGGVVASITGRTTLIILLALTSILPATAAAADSGSAIEDCLLEAANAERRAIGLGPLAEIASMVDPARQHSADMASAGELFHDEPITAGAPDGWTAVGENVAMAFDCASLHQAFMSSDAHRSKILDPRFNGTAVGVASAADGSQLGTAAVFATVRFVALPTLTTAAAAPSGSFVDDDGSPFEPAIEWMASMGITAGCNPPEADRYCPYDSLTRGEAAVMLTRALNPPFTKVDFFGDDGGSFYEAAANRLAAAGVMVGCDSGVFCGEQPLSRGEMAVLLSRALGLTDPGPGDWFADDDGSPYESFIDLIAASGITQGCGPDRFCPDTLITRGQIAAILFRALSG